MLSLNQIGYCVPCGLSPVVVVVLDLLEEETEAPEVLVADEQPLLRCAPLDLLPEETTEDVYGALNSNRVDVSAGNVPVNVLLAHHNVRVYHAVKHPLVKPVVCLFGAGGPRIEEPGRRVFLVTDEDDSGRPSDPAGVNGQ